MMKKLLLILSFALILIPFDIMAQSCCSMSANKEFALLGKDNSFSKQHDNPLPYTYDGDAGEMVTYKTDDSKTASAFVLKSSLPSNKYILVIHEWWGLNDHIKKEGERIFNSIKGVNVICLDLYDGKVANTREEAAEYMGQVSEERAKSIINGAVEYAGEDAVFASIGWCFGGGWSLQTAILTGSSNKACIVYYGMPEKDLNKLKNIEAPVLGIFASKDQWISPTVVEQFEKNMEMAGKKLQVFTFVADHAFANPSSPNYRNESANKAWEISMDFLKTKLK